jgi:peptidoglycan hydrolase-like protein with peptidoglycan-binding domain
MRILTAVLISFGLAFCMPLGAAQKKPAPAKAKAKTTTSKSKAKTSAKTKKPAPTRYAQQHPTSERYTEIQQALVERGYLPEANGVWGPESLAALKKFQQEQGLPSDGKLGALSLTALGLGPRRGGTVEDAITAGVLPAGNTPTPLD